MPLGGSNAYVLQMFFFAFAFFRPPQ